MSKRTDRLPAYRHYKPKDLAVVRIEGRDFYLGMYGSTQSREKYGRLLSDWIGTGRPPVPPRIQAEPTGTTIDELILAFYRHAEGYYVKDGRQTTEVGIIKSALGPLRRLYGTTEAAAFGPNALKLVRQEYVNAGHCLTEVNRKARVVVRAFGWAVENEMIPAPAWQALKAVKGLRKGRTKAREMPPIRPVDDPPVDAIRPHVAPQVWAMIELQRLTGMRPGEVCRLTTGALDGGGPVWVFTPPGHKTEHHEKERPIYLGPKAQQVIKPWLRADPDAYLFSPIEADAARKAAMRQARKTPVQPSQQDRSKARPIRKPGPATRRRATGGRSPTAATGPILTRRWPRSPGGNGPPSRRPSYASGVGPTAGTRTNFGTRPLLAFGGNSASTWRGSFSVTPVRQRPRSMRSWTRSRPWTR